MTNGADRPIKKGRKTWLSRSRAWICIVLLAPVASMAAFSTGHVPANSWVTLGLELTGWLLFLSGAFYRWWATLYIGGRKSKDLVCDGPYSTCRHALYFGTFLMVLAIAVFAESLVLTVAVVGVSVLYLSITVPREDERLLHRHRDAYVKYRERVPAFFPRFRRLQSPASVHVQLDGLRAELFRSCRWICLPFLCRLLVHLRSEQWWPHWFNLL